MRKIKKGDIVGRISYGKDIFFIVEDIINLNKKEIAILKGLTIRIKADSPVEDLEILSKELIPKSRMAGNSNADFGRLNRREFFNTKIKPKKKSGS